VSDGQELNSDDVAEILRILDESDVAELELETARFTLRFRRDSGADPHVVASSHASMVESSSALLDVRAPMVGTFYRAPAPGEPPLVEVGDDVDTETTVCIIEVMKLMNSTVAGVRGTIVEVCVENASPVQYGEVLFRVRPT